MFTGIVEEVGEVMLAEHKGSNLDLVIRATMAPELQVDQSVSHNGVCLTVVEVLQDRYRVTAIEETLERSTLATLMTGDRVNLERSLRIGDRLDGHMVQGHVDGMVKCVRVEDRGGSHLCSFLLPPEKHLLVHKGSICLNGTSLTIASMDAMTFSVAVIPYTWENTTFQQLQQGMRMNVEFDVLGKYVARMLEGRLNI